MTLKCALAALRVPLEYACFQFQDSRQDGGAKRYKLVNIRFFYLWLDLPLSIMTGSYPPLDKPT